MKEVIENFAESLITVSNDSLHIEQCALPQNLQDDYKYFLSRCDGGYTKDLFFHFFGRHGPPQHNLHYWNQPGLWKAFFGLGETDFVFGEDIFGTQFCFDIRGTRKAVKMLVPASGKLTLCANSFEDYLQSEVLSVSSSAEIRHLAESFLRVKREEFHPFTHIACKKPPSLGGNDADFANLELSSSLTNLRILGQIHGQLKNFPPGARIKGVKIDREKEEVILVPEN